MKNKIKAGIVGGAGYTGGEMVRLLVNHPHVEIAFVQSRSQSGKMVSDIHRDLLGDCDLVFTGSHRHPVDVVFLCLGHGESKVFLEGAGIPSSTKVIDLSQDFRLGEKSNGRDFVYGLPELNKEAIKQAGNIANPGCFATTIMLGLLPLAGEGALGEVHATGITGSTGAGQQLQETSHFSWRANNISAYKTLTHQHLKEINQTLKGLQPGFNGGVHFVPWRGAFSRGIYVSAITKSSMSLGEAYGLYGAFYKAAPFTHVSESMIDLKQVVNTNKCLVHIEKVKGNLVVHTATDNLLKGASGQAVQNMNLMFGLDEAEGLRLKANIH
ncbi:MAG: N-acetyl-gamma-glutamyl-phosphate reductase [Cyclobacteriaceae bacterium]|nr:N-acetyl-gamma-glutamyl-phosphate reductase [Cyclobacteriaceae bacterium]MCB9238838.1 N-acetyl-gamma-glutamyl-phosphate reductase [Flammeovirgaceae bacterium]MCB0498114.1 N-acetyl-gamma-glutamyl-phosphate reductase [Cyclobacteriaceae bacterium]MCO5270557.1 N-acetyl-gamma-glutamyl-phosphate reductase [Cyclobacteriaceae bacterium]MCW5901002.1 N-acetyl-gamma-glutamyl-phosphate reductase [Cyclobacteriaceae bacterium]